MIKYIHLKRSTRTIDKKNEQVVGPHKTCQIGMARGLCHKWKQIIYYEYDKPLTVELIMETISKLYKAGYIAVAVTCDRGSMQSMD